MTRLQRLYVRSAIGVAGGLLIGLAIVGVLEYRDGSPVASGGPGLATAKIAPAKSPAAMTLHDAPRPVPELRFADGDGGPITLADFRDKVVLLNIWATWCGPCRAEMPTLDRLQAALGGLDFEVVALSIDRAGIEAVDRFYAEIGVKHLGRYIDVSAKAARDLGAYGLPTTLLIDRDGREVARHVGPAEWDTPSMVMFFSSQLSRETGATPTTSNRQGSSS
ncbi:MAG: TlpA disulfide reductase family protein [Marinovum algicola]|uniref:TlpA family protein disulfide reductase n=1 Tax=Marinovum algicola TaxID=42444 RepID=UPI0032EBC6C0